MAKYSTGGSSGGGDGDTCELCGAASENLSMANVAGARLNVCASCAPHDDTETKRSSNDTGSESGSGGERDRKRRAVQNAAKANDVWDSDSGHWEEEGTNYDDDQLPYLHNDYGKTVTEARQERGLQREEFAEELGATEADIIAIEQGRATQAGIGGGLIAAIEDYLDVEISEQ
ncbi:multiprotein-bridging factor 1 family protein [Halorubellus sp. PRR65]|uniref:helix-turn-helix domain-containing protein n=1 Tax=Halorubellus sp. PRR65 TaxID=3098148 RepID=UPI002B25CED0|nr:multiprotein-bridging factor 1 family protein [Halorubellus sp. PRR65]